MRTFMGLSGLLLAALSTAATAAETITYSYDARGRLVGVVRSGDVNDGAATTYVYDKADNRTNVTTTTGGGGGMAAVQPSPQKTPPAPSSGQAVPK